MNDLVIATDLPTNEIYTTSVSNSTSKISFVADLLVIAKPPNKRE